MYSVYYERGLAIAQQRGRGDRDGVDPNYTYTYRVSVHEHVVVEWKEGEAWILHVYIHVKL